MVVAPVSYHLDEAAKLWYIMIKENIAKGKGVHDMTSVIRRKPFVLGYRMAALLIITLGLAGRAHLFSGSINWHVFLAYTIQSNLLAWLLFAVLIFKTASKKAPAFDAHAFGFYPVISFAASIAILITMLIFWGVLAPKSWSGGSLWTFSNLAVHLFGPLLMIGDRILFYKTGIIKRRHLLAVIVFPIIYIIQSFAIGLTRAVYFSPLNVNSYYLYPFLDFDAHGYLVFAFIIALAAGFLGLGYAWYFIEKRIAAKATR